MGARSGFRYGGRRWLIREPEDWHGRLTLTWDELLHQEWTRQGESGLVLGATVAGLLMVDFSSLPEALVKNSDSVTEDAFRAEMEAMRTRVNVANVFALAVHSATLEVLKTSDAGFRVTHEDLIHFNDNSEGFGGNVEFPAIPGQGLLMPRSRFGCLPREALDRAGQTVDHAIAGGADTLNLLALLNHSLVACKDHDFDLAVVTAWAICERLLGRELESYASGQAEAHALRVTRERRRAWSRMNAATMTEVLALAGALTAELDERTDRARRARNAWIHGGLRPPYQAAVEAVQLAADLIDRTLGIEVKVSPSVGVIGLGN